MGKHELFEITNFGKTMWVLIAYCLKVKITWQAPVAISTRVAPSFLRVGQLELFGRRARKNEHADALKELEMIVLHLIEREYKSDIDQDLPLAEKLLANDLPLTGYPKSRTPSVAWTPLAYVAMASCAL